MRLRSKPACLELMNAKQGQRSLPVFFYAKMDAVTPHLNNNFAMLEYIYNASSFRSLYEIIKESNGTINPNFFFIEKIRDQVKGEKNLDEYIYILEK